VIKCNVPQQLGVFGALTIQPYICKYEQMSMHREREGHLTDVLEIFHI